MYQTDKYTLNLDISFDNDSVQQEIPLKLNEFNKDHNNKIKLTIDNEDLNIKNLRN